MKPAMLSMNQSSVININSRAWNVLCWNVRGINDKEKWNSIRNKIEESGANIFCLQETKREAFDIQYVRKFAPKCFDKFDYCPSLGGIGGNTYLLV
jgi:exonuclease III